MGKAAYCTFPYVIISNYSEGNVSEVTLQRFGTVTPDKGMMFLVA